MSACCPFHPTGALVPLPCSREPCDGCGCAGSVAVTGCRVCGYGVCRWCNVAGSRLFESLMKAEAALADLRCEIAAVKAKIDGDVFVWV
jgi:hypothetical protein